MRSRLLRPSKSTLRLMLIGLVALLAAPAGADYVGEVQTKLYLAPESLQLLLDRAAAGGANPGFLEDDVIEYLVEFTPVDRGGEVGPNGYVTFYVPDGLEVVGAEIVQRDGRGGFVAVPPELPGQMALGSVGNRGDGTWDIDALAGAVEGDCWDSYAWCDGDASGCSGGMAQLYADTGVFYSTDDRTAVFTGTASDFILEGVNGYNISPTGDDATTTHNFWDASNTNAFGTKNAPTTAPFSPIPIASSDGKGDTPLGTGAAVAGPQSGYQLDYTGCVGPWQRIAYVGSRRGDDPTDEVGEDIGYGITGAPTDLGWDLSEDNALPEETNAIRFAVGRVVVGEVRHVRIRFRLTEDPTDGYVVNSEVFGGDTAAENIDGSTLSGKGKDSAWRYHIPTVAWNPSNLTIIKRVIGVADPVGGDCPAPYTGTPSDPNDHDYEPVLGDSVAPGTRCLLYAVTYLNTGNSPLTSVTIYDTLPDETLDDLTSDDITVFEAVEEFLVNPDLDLAGGDRDRLGNVGTLNPAEGGNLVFPVRVDVGDGDQIINLASMCLGFRDNDDLCAKASVITIGADWAVLEITKTADPAVAAPGDDVTFTLTVTNNGGDTATDLGLRDVLPSVGGDGADDRFSYVSATSAVTGLDADHSPTTSLVPDVPGFVADVNTQQVEWPDMASDSLDAGESFTVTFDATIGVDVPVGEFINTARVDYFGRTAGFAYATASVTIDGCPDDPDKLEAGACGCGVVETGDSDGDGILDCEDPCPYDPLNDADADGWCGDVDCEEDATCPDPPVCDEDDTPSDVTPPECQDPCPYDPINDVDTDGVCGPEVCSVPEDCPGDPECSGGATTECVDGCPTDSNKTEPGTCGCGVSDIDSDGDGTADCDDPCPYDPDNDADGDGWCGEVDCEEDATCPEPPTCDDDDPLGTDTPPECVDPCPYDPINDVDTDGVCGTQVCTVPEDCPGDPECTGGATTECVDGCPTDTNKTEPGTCGCGVSDIDSDGDGTADCADPCPYDPLNDADADGWCGDVDCEEDATCPEPPVCDEDDTPSDVTPPECQDPCPYDPINDVDTDGVCGTQVCTVPEDCPGDPECTGGATTECVDGCPTDTNKTEPGVCGCGVSDFDSDGDGTADCADPCPYDPDNDADDDGWCGEVDCEEDATCPEPPVCDDDDATDGDIPPECIDPCPYDPDNDVDEDGVCGPEICVEEDVCPGDPECTEGETEECTDGCPEDTSKTEPGLCGCGVSDGDSDGDGTVDCLDPCPFDPLNDADGDGWCGDVDCEEDATCPEPPVCTESDIPSLVTPPECLDPCPYDPVNDVDEDGVCGTQVCTLPEDCPGQPECSDGGTTDCVDGCPEDTNKTEPGVCGCGDVDIDSDSDGTADCDDPCPFDALNDVDSDGICSDVCVEAPAECLEGPCRGGETADCRDNCPDDLNADQADADSDGIGDVCDACPLDADNDPDGDGICQTTCVGDECLESPCTGGETAECEDNCPEDENADQADYDSDGIGDVCDVCPYDPLDDGDEDGICDAVCVDDEECSEGPCSGGATLDCDDNCPLVANEDQADEDDNGIGDACDDECRDDDTDCDGIVDDGDGSGEPGDDYCLDLEVVDCDDNCPLVANADQADSNGDGQGDACEDDQDGDGVPDDDDNCVTTPNTDQADLDGDGMGDLCDDDADGDGSDVTEDCDDLDEDVIDGELYYPDRDEDGVGAGDGVAYCPDDPRIQDLVTTSDDNCPDRSNADQSDSNDNGVGDVCDPNGAFSVAGGGACGTCAVGPDVGPNTGLFALLWLLGLAVLRRRR